MEPKPFSPTDAAEQEAIAVFLNLIDHQYIRPDIRQRDTYPNTDGTVAIVNEKNVPVAQLEVQIRKIPINQTKYSCPSSLVAHSDKSTTLPVILICVDTANECAYWKHISPLMQEFKPKQKGFTIHFSKVSDSIDSTGIYIQKWRELFKDYKERVNKAPTITAQIANQLELTGISRADKRYFQTFVDTINRLLDADFITVKNILYPGVWKLGVGIVSSDPTHYRYQIYKIPEDEPSIPLVSRIEVGSVFTDAADPKVILKAVASRDYAQDPIKAAETNVYREVSEVIEGNQLPIYGSTLSADILIAFVDRYYRCIGVKPNRNSYSVEELAYGLNVYLHLACLNYINIAPISPGAIYSVDLDSVNDLLFRSNVKPLEQMRIPGYFIQSRNFPLNTVYSSIQYLQAKRIRKIDRLFGIEDRNLQGVKNWVYMKYSPENEIRSVTNVLNSSIDAYSSFVTGNRLQFPESPYLDSKTAIIYEYEPIGSETGHKWPSLREYHVKTQELPKLSVMIQDLKEPRIDTTGFPIIKFDGKEYNETMSSISEAAYLFQSAPVYKHIFEMLKIDMQRHYEIIINPHLF